MRRTAALLLLVAALARAGDGEVDRLREENVRLRARVAELEAENAKLKRQGSAPLAAALERSAAEAVETTRDPKTGETVVRVPASRLEAVRGGRSRYWLSLRADRGAAAAPAELVIASSASGRLYRDVPTFAVDTDGARHDCAVVRYASEARSVVRAAGTIPEAETVTVAVPAPVLAAIADASDVRGTLGPTEFRLTPAQIAQIRALRERLGS